MGASLARLGFWLRQSVALPYGQSPITKVQTDNARANPRVPSKTLYFQGFQRLFANLSPNNFYLKKHILSQIHHSSS